MSWACQGHLIGVSFGGDCWHLHYCPLHTEAQQSSNSSEAYAEMRTAVDEEGMAVNGVRTVHDIHMRGLSKKHIEKDIRSSMPSRMYCAPEVYELERRAIFSKRWFLVSHKARYRNVGDFVLYEMAGFSFMVVRNKEQRLVGFHNICRYDLGIS
jgi:hypothetical protein